MSKVLDFVNSMPDKRNAFALAQAFDKLAGRGIVAAVGTSQATAAALSYAVNLVTGADATKAVRLPIPQPDDSGVWVINTSATLGLPVYPAVDGQINALGTDAAFTLGAGQMALFQPSTKILWYTAAAFAASANGVEATLQVNGPTVNANLGLVTVGTVVTAAGTDISANVGRVTGVSANLLNSSGTVTGFRGCDLRITDNGTAANAVAIQGLLTKASGVSSGEGWTGNFVFSQTGGKYEDVFGVASDVDIGPSASVGSGTGEAVNNAVAGRFASYVAGGATLSAVMIDSPLLAVVKGGATNRAKADAAVMAMIEGGSAGLVTAESAFAVRDYKDAAITSGFDYGLNLYFNSSPWANAFTVADIKLSGGPQIHSGSGSPSGSVTGAKGSIYLNFTAGSADLVLYVNTDGGTSWTALTS